MIALTCSRHLAQLAALTALAAPTLAQSILVNRSTVVARSGETTPDSAGLPLSNLTFDTTSSGNPFTTPVLNESGDVLFRSEFVDSNGPLQGFEEEGYYHGSSSTDLVRILRGGDSAPGQVPGVLLRMTAASVSSLASNIRLSPDGRIWFGATMSDGNVTIDSTNDSGVFGGLPGALGTFVQKGSVAPGSGGATFIQAFKSVSYNSSGIARGGRIYFTGSSVTGSGMPPVVTTQGMNNQGGLWAGMPGALELVARRSSPVSGLGGAVLNGSGNMFGFGAQMNDAGELLYEVTLSQALGTPAATSTTDRALMIHRPGQGSVKLVREGDPAPGIPSVTFGELLTDNWSPDVPSSSLLRDGTALFVCTLTGAIGFEFNDRVVVRGTPGNLTIVAQTGDVAPMIPGAFFDRFNGAAALHNSSGQIALRASLRGAVTLDDDSGIWVGQPGSLELGCREGQVMPGTGGGIVSSLVNTSMLFNDSGVALFRCTLSGGTNPGTSLWAYGPNLELTPIVLSGETYEVAPGVSKVVDGFIYQSANNSDGTSLAFSHDGRLALRLSFEDDTSAIVVVNVPLGGIQPFCMGNGGLAPGCTPCPCGNNAVVSSPGGCLNSSSTSAILEGTGFPGVGNDSLRFEVTAARAASFGVLVSADNQLPNTGSCPAGSGTNAAFDGLRCVGGALLRHGTRATDANGAIGVTNNGWGPPNGPIGGIVQNGGFSVGQTRHFQCFYRDNPAFGCGTGQNTTNAVSVTIL